MGFELHHADCHDLLRELPDKSANLIMTSPPYAMARKSTYGGIKPGDYLDWFMPLSDQLHRILADDGSFVLNIKEGCDKGERLTYVLELILELTKTGGWLWTEEYVWHKTNSAPGKWPNRFRDGWERLLHFTKRRDFKMRQDEVMVPTGEATKNRTAKLKDRERVRQERATGSGFGMNFANWDGREMVYPSNVLHGAGECQNKGHPAVYPEWIPEFFVKLFTDEGDSVLDPFMGSGTTGVVALRHRRDFVGIDLMAEYVELARRRLT